MFDPELIERLNKWKQIMKDQQELDKRAGKKGGVLEGLDLDNMTDQEFVDFAIYLGNEDRLQDVERVKYINIWKEAIKRTQEADKLEGIKGAYEGIDVDNMTEQKFIDLLISLMKGDTRSENISRWKKQFKLMQDSAKETGIKGVYEGIDIDSLTEWQTIELIIMAMESDDE